MSRQTMILTGPQAIGIGALALGAWCIRGPIRRLAHLAYWGPAFLWPDETDDYVDLVGANPDLFLDPPSTSQPKENQ